MAPEAAAPVSETAIEFLPDADEIERRPLPQAARMTLYALAAMVLVFTVAATGLKAYLPAFWSLPSLFLTEAAAAGSIGLINSVGNLGGYVGPKVLGYVENEIGSFVPGILFLSISMAASAAIILLLGLGKKDASATLNEAKPVVEPLSEPA